MQPPVRRRVTTSDLDQARAEVAEIFCAHDLHPVDRTAPLAVRLRSASLASMGLTYLEYGAAVRIDPVPFRDFVLVQVPITGRAEITSGPSMVVSDPGLASVPDPDVGARMRWDAGNAQIIFYARRDALERQLGRLLGRPEPHPVRFTLSLSMTDARAAAWWRSVELLKAEIISESPMLQEPLAMRQLEQMIMSRLLLAHRHSASDSLTATRAPQTRAVARARQIMDDRAHDELTVADVAEAVGVSLRALQEGFRRDLATTPSAYLRDLRLRRAHEELRTGDPTTTSVTAIAHACGFVHLGRFSVEYRRHYGEPPSRTLLRN